MNMLIFSCYRPLHLALTSMELTCAGNVANSQYFILSKKFTSLVDLVSHYFDNILHKDTDTMGASLKTKEKSTADTWTVVCGMAVSVIANVISCSMLQDIIDQRIMKDCVG